jgi:hypothetical protein
MQKVHLKEDYRDAFSSAGLESFDDFFNYADGDIINKNTKRNVLKFTLDHNGTKKQFFMKRFCKPHFKDMAFTYFNFGHICSQAECEWNNANALLDNSIDTYHPVCYGEHIVCGIEINSFFITTQIHGVSLTDFVSAKWASISRQEKENIIASIGKLTRKMHDVRMSLPDLYLWHFFIKEDISGQGDHQFAVIDLHRMSTNAGKGARYKNLAAFTYSLSEKYFDDRLKKLFLDAYMGDDFPNDPDKLVSTVNRRIATITARRRRVKY